ncbi:hypothetical protein OF117_12770 [Geodermatophilus sp. YIM 151500]|uniref:hypothetical protein n=1 Tax=Geodermatophilus sp. YIM 151500 TaxID=2984531 RepID=UPI0021E4286D|nr:hypothetical protein [Geodermatophilus sp. YIM 151500]MCV2490237.1 hypothetical protein [Geodermatophilus sp. YIM 151500]
MTAPPPAPGDDGGGGGVAAPMPASVRVAVVLLALLAVLLLVNAGLSWFGREAIADRIAEVQPDVTREEAERLVVGTQLPYVVIGLAAAAAAVGLPRRRPWARWAGVAGAVGLALLTVVSMATAGGATALSLLVLVLSVGAVTSLLARTTGQWVPPLRGG